MEQLPEGRRERILAEVRDRGMVGVGELAGLLGVSAVTIRRDIASLVEEGALRRIRGGVASLWPDTHAPTGATPNPVARVGMLVPSLDYHWPKIIEGAKAEAADQGVELLLRSSAYGRMDATEQVGHLLAAGATGLLLAPDPADPALASLLAGLADDGVPVVLVERDWEPGWTSFPDVVATDHAAGTEAAVGHLVAVGHQRIGLLLHRDSPHAAAIRLGWTQAMIRHGLTQGDLLAWVVRRGEAGFEPSMADVVSRFRSLGATAVLAHADLEAIGLVQACEALGIRVPRDVSVVAHDDEVAGLFTPALTAIRSPRESIGRAAVSLLASRLRDPGRPPHRLAISPRLSVRDSVSAPQPGDDAGRNAPRS